MRKTTLTSREALLLVQIGGLVSVLPLLQRMWSLPKLVRFFDGRADAKRAAAPVAPERLVKLTEAVLRRTHRKEFCMPRTLVLFYFLRKWEYPVRINFGISRQEGRLAGHAWLECDGQPLAEGADPHTVYKTVYFYPPTTTSEVVR